MTVRFLKCATVLAALFNAAGAGAAERAAPPVVPAGRAQVTLTFAPVVKSSAPAVVNIYARKILQAGPTARGPDPYFLQFYRDRSKEQEGAGTPERVQNSLGSGVIVRGSGVVITNFHVAGDADEIRVVLNDRREFPAKVLGKDERSDLAVLQLEGVTDALPSLDLSESDSVEVGDLVLAIGNPFGVGQTVTMGIVSALARTTVGDTRADFRSFIQTDAAINPGNSGGALITSDGRLVGINTVIFSRTGGNTGIGFAIPANMARNVLDSILKAGHAVRPWLGAAGKAVTAELAKTLALPRPQGVLIDRLMPSSPAASAGLVVGDIIRTVNGREVNDFEELRYLFATLPIGQKAKVEALHAGKPHTFSIALQAPPEIPARQLTQLTGLQPFGGASVANLNPAIAEELGIDYKKAGIVILAVAPNSPAAGMGLRAADLVLLINEVPMNSVDDIELLTSIEQPRWNVFLERAGQIMQLQVRG